MATEQPVLAFASRGAFAQPGSPTTTRSATASGSGSRRRAREYETVVYAEALEVALCFGWIDGQVKNVDETYYMQRWTPAAGAQQVVEDQLSGTPSG